MPVKRTTARPAHTHPKLVEGLVSELRHPSDRSGAGIPDIMEEEQTFGDRLHVTVVWDRWQGVDHSQRGPVILDAYREVKGDAEMLRITLAQGFTMEEHRRYLSTQDN